MKLYFEDSRGFRHLIGEPKDKDQSWKMISKFCKKRNFSIPYVRSWTTADGETYYDVGSHTEFFIEID